VVRTIPRIGRRRGSFQSIDAAAPMPILATEASGQTTATAATAPTLTVSNGTGDGQHDVGKTLTNNRRSPPSGQDFAGWSGDIQILANPSISTMTADNGFD
jgi:hypothetical protein